MTTSRLRALVLLLGFALLAFSADGVVRRSWADAAIADDHDRRRVRTSARRSLVLASAATARGRPSPADRLVFKMRITPHWFDQNNRFWYRNDLPGGAKEFILVDAEHGTRRRPLTTPGSPLPSRKRPVQVYKADRLPFDEIEFVDGSKAFRFECDRATWKCSLESYECSKTEPDRSAPESSNPAGHDTAPRRGRPTSERPGPDAPGPHQGLRSPDGKWTAFVKDHNVFIRAEGKSEETRLSTDGKEGLAYGRLSWSPDSKTLVAFRIEPGDRKEVYLIQSSPPGGGRAKLRTRPYPLPGDKFTAYELNLFDVAAKKAIRPKVDRIDFGSPRLRWDKDGRHFTYEKTDRGHQRFRLIRVDSHTGEARNLIDEKSETFIWTAHREAVGLRHRHLAGRSRTSSSTSRSATAGGTST